MTEYKSVSSILLEQLISGDKNIALRYKKTEVSYRELYYAVINFAKYIRGKGIGRNDIIAVAFDPSIDMIVVIIGIIVSGAAYLPLDKKIPRNRMKYILEDSGAKLLIADEKITSETIVYREIDCAIYEEAPLHTINEKDDLVYVIYTSGTTGMPKGVMITHKNLYSFIQAINKAIDYKQCRVALLLTNISFDISILEMIVPLIYGMKIVIVPSTLNYNIRKLLRYIKENKVEILQITPSRLKLFIMIDKWYHYLYNIKKILVGGEEFPDRLKCILEKVDSAEIYNMYGPTETTIWATYCKLEKDKAITIGKALSNTKVFILNSEFRPVKNGEIGRLFIAGEGVACGYINNDNLTEEKFICIGKDATRIYDTGDLGKWDCEGNIIFKGRADFQIKLNGHRIEIEEIENLMLRMKGIDDVCVIKIDNDEEEHLHAFYVGKICDSEEIYTFLSQELPNYMIPRKYTHLLKLPINQNGKRDRKKLAILARNQKSFLMKNICHER